MINDSTKPIWVNNLISEKLIKPYQIIPIGFVKGRLPKKKKIDDLVIQFSRDQIYQKYIIENIPYQECIQQLNLSRSDFRLLLDYYNIKKSAKLARQNNTYKHSKDTYKLIGIKSSATQKLSWKNKSSDEKQIWSNKCRNAQLNMSPEMRTKHTEHMIATWYNKSQAERYKINQQRSNSCKKAWANSELIDKSNQMKRLNRLQKGKRLCRTLAEQKCYDILKLKYPSLQYDVKVDSRYPYYVDFYISELDLFIELQAHPSHGKVPYSFGGSYEGCKLYGEWLHIYSVVDVAKYDCAVTNNINLIRIYPDTTLENNFMINNHKFDDLVESIYYSQK